MNINEKCFIVRPLLRITTICFVFSTITLLGCSGRGSVSGKVTFNGKPVNGGTVTFVPIGGDNVKEPGKPATGTVQADGTYTLGTFGTSDGAVAGRHQVSYTAPLIEFPKEKSPREGESMPFSPFAGLVPKQKEVDVTSGSNTIDIELVRPKK